jgi:hypothetical protein
MSAEPQTGRRLFTFAEWIARRRISSATGRRILRSGAIRYVHLSKRKIGVFEDDDDAALAATAIEPSRQLDSRAIGGPRSRVRSKQR